MKKNLLIFTCMLLMFVVAGLICANNKPTAIFLGSLSSVEAMAQNEDWKGKNLKLQDCTCSNGKTGKTAKCKSDGDLEACSATQQGLTACYKVNLSGVKLCDL